jgi:hypothetical protein
MEAHRSHLDVLRKAGLPVDAYSDQMIAQLAALDEREVQSIVAIRQKLNEGLDEQLKKAADTVGGFVW